MPALLRPIKTIRIGIQQNQVTMHKVPRVIRSVNAIAPRDGKTTQQLQLFDDGTRQRLIVGKKRQMFQTLSRSRSRPTLSTPFMPMLEGHGHPETRASRKMGNLEHGHTSNRDQVPRQAKG